MEVGDELGAGQVSIFGIGGIRQESGEALITLLDGDWDGGPDGGVVVCESDADLSRQ